jgi:hypothetical protein
MVAPLSEVETTGEREFDRAARRIRVEITRTCAMCIPSPHQRLSVDRRRTERVRAPLTVKTRSEGLLRFKHSPGTGELKLELQRAPRHVFALEASPGSRHTRSRTWIRRSGLADDSTAT